MLKPTYLICGHLLAISVPDLVVVAIGLHDEAMPIPGLIWALGVEFATVFVQLDAGVVGYESALTPATNPTVVARASYYPAHIINPSLARFDHSQVFLDQ